MTDAEKLIIEELKKMNSHLDKLSKYIDSRIKAEDDRQEAVRAMASKIPGFPGR